MTTARTWLHGWYDPCLVDIWEEFVASWTDEPAANKACVFFPAGYYSRQEAEELINQHYAASRPAFCALPSPPETGAGSGG